MGSLQQAQQTKTASNLLLLLVLFVLGASLYFQSMHYPFSNIDDVEYVVRNGDIRRINLDFAERWLTRHYVLIYLPITVASFAIDYQIWLLNPFGYHFTNFILHCLNGFFVYLLLFRLFRNRSIAVYTSLIFLIHPVQVESVVWISERKNLLSTFFFLLSFACYVKDKRPHAALFFLMSLLSKPVAILTPVLFFLYDYLFKKRLRFWFYTILISFSVFIAWFTFQTHVQEVIYRGSSPAENFYIMSSVFLKYLRLLFFPYTQQFYYLTRVYRSLFEWPVFLSILSVFAMLAAIVGMRRSNPCASFGLCWYLVWLALPSNFLMPMGTLMHDRYLYVPMIGFYAALFSIFAKASGGILFERKDFVPRLATFLSIGLLAAAFYILSYQRAGNWKTMASVWQEDIRKSKYPDPRSYIGLASALNLSGGFQNSINLINESLKYRPEDETGLLWRAQNYLMLNDLDGVKKSLEEAEKMSHGVLTSTYFDIYGQYYERIGEYHKAEAAYQTSIFLRRKVPPYIHLAAVYRKMGAFTKVLDVLKEAADVDPDSEFVLAEFCKYYWEQGDVEKSNQYYKRLALIYPNSPLVKYVSNETDKIKSEQNSSG